MSHFATGIQNNLDGRSTVAADIDNDGDLDLILRNLRSQPVQIYRNTLSSKTHWLEIQLRTTGGNTHAVGARVMLTCAGQKQLRQVTAGNSYLGQSPYRLFFGLGSCSGPVSLQVFWPDGARDIVEVAEVDRRIVVAPGGSITRTPAR